MAFLRSIIPGGTSNKCARVMADAPSESGVVLELVEWVHAHVMMNDTLAKNVTSNDFKTRDPTIYHHSFISAAYHGEYGFITREHVALLRMFLLLCFQMATNHRDSGHEEAIWKSTSTSPKDQWMCAFCLARRPCEVRGESQFLQLKGDLMCKTCVDRRLKICNETIGDIVPGFLTQFETKTHRCEDCEQWHICCNIIELPQLGTTDAEAEEEGVQDIEDYYRCYKCWLKSLPQPLSEQHQSIVRDWLNLWEPTGEC